MTNSDLLYGTKGGSQLLVEEIRREICQGHIRTGEKIAPVRQLAQLYNISFGSARAALGKLEKMKLVARKRGSGTYVTYCKDKDNRSQEVYLMLRSKEHVYDHLTAELVVELQRAGLLPINTALENSGDFGQLTRIISRWSHGQPKAIVLQLKDPEIDKALIKGIAPSTRIITTFRPEKTLPDGWHSVNPDRPAACERIFKHFIDRKHQKIGYVIPARHPDRYLCKVGRLSDSELASILPRIKRSIGEQSLHKSLAVFRNRETPFSESEMARIGKWLSQPNRPTAIFGTDYRMAAVCRAAEKLGLNVPGDLEIIGMGNTPWAEALDLTSVWYREDLLAHQIASLVTCEHKELEGCCRHIKISCEIIFRTSCPK